MKKKVCDGCEMIRDGKCPIYKQDVERLLCKTPFVMTPILMAEEFWANSHFSIVRHTGRVNINGQIFVIVNKEGKDIFECSIEAEREGREKAIPPGEPCDLIDERFMPYYRKMGRDKFIEYIETHNVGAETMLKELKVLSKNKRK